MESKNKRISTLKKYLFSGIALFTVTSAWVASGVSGSIARLTPLLRLAATPLTDLAAGTYLTIVAAIGGNTFSAWNTGGNYRAGGSTSIQAIYGAPVQNPGYQPGGVSLVSPPITQPPQVQAVYGAPAMNPGYIPGQATPAYPVPDYTHVQAVYGAPALNPGYTQPVDYMASWSTHLTGMLNPHQITPEAAISALVYVVWLSLTFWAVLGWAFSGVIVYLKKREALKD